MATSFVGHKAMESLQQVLHQLGIRRLMLIRGGRSYEACGAKSIIDKIIAAEDIQVTEFSGFSVNPHYEEALEGKRLLMDSGAHCILVVGGGSAMDTGKLIRHMASAEGYQSLLLAVATTAGTGAEVTRFSIVCKDGLKQSMQEEDILPDYAFVYPPFIYGVSGYLAACTGFDALAHAIESYWSRSANAESKGFALKAIDLIWENLPKVVHMPESAVCDAIAEGSFWAGRAINVTKTTAPHAFSYAFTTECDYPHGHAVALTFPYFFGVNLSVEDPLVERLHLDKNISLETQMRNYLHSIGLDYRGCGNNDLSELLARVNMAKLANNPVEMDTEKMQLLAESFVNYY